MKKMKNRIILNQKFKIKFWKCLSNNKKMKKEKKKIRKALLNTN